MKSSANTVEEYLATLPEGRRDAIAAVRDLVNRKLPKGYRETMEYGMIVWSVPLEVHPDTYNGQPLAYAGLASQKQNMAIYLMTIYANPKIESAFREGFARAGKKLNMGKSCVRFRRLEELHLPAVAQAIAAWPMAEFIRRSKAVHGSTGRAARKAAREAEKPAAMRAATSKAAVKPRAKAASQRTVKAAKRRPAATRATAKKRAGSR